MPDRHRPVRLSRYVLSTYSRGIDSDGGGSLTAAEIVPAETDQL